LNFPGGKETLGKDDELVRGFYGKKNPVIADFGTKVPAVRRSKKPPPPRNQRREGVRKASKVTGEL
jgi:hypothetical protein